MQRASKRRNLVNNELNGKTNEDIKPNSTTQDCSTDQKKNDSLNSKICKKIKLEKQKMVKSEDKDKDSERNVKNSTQTKVVNGVKQNSSYLESVENIGNSDKNVLTLNVTQKEQSCNNLTVFDKATVISSIHNDHNYLAMQ